MTMRFRITGGRDSIIGTPLIVFKNQNCSYSIRGPPDNVPGVLHRSGKKGWMVRRVFVEWLSEPAVIKKHPSGEKRIPYVDNCSGHNLTTNVGGELEAINAELRKFPANATDLVQPADSFVISKIKDAYKRMWEEFKAEQIAQGEGMGCGEGQSGKLKNPGKHFFPELCAAAARKLNEQRDKNGLTCARKAMIRTGMARNWNGLWEEKQLSQELQGIIASAPQSFRRRASKLKNHGIVDND